jgi:acyl-coenzyme A thioesterase PaaI-like protein
MTEPVPPATHQHWAWRPDDTPPEGQRAALHRLASAIRSTIDLLVESDAPEEELLAAAEDAERLNQRLAAGPRGHTLWGFAEASTSGNPRAFFDSSPIGGKGNPIAAPVDLRLVGNHVEGRVVFGIAYEGPPGHVHGGFVAAAFDEVLGMAQSSTGAPGMTGTLTVRYRRPTPLHTQLLFLGKVDRVEGRKIFTSATLHAGEILCAEAEGIFISMGIDHFRRLAEKSQEG